MKKLDKKYTTKTENEPTKPGCWDYLQVGIYRDGEKVGEYKRNYHNMYHTFYPFEWREKEYALYSHDYQTVSLMSLPDCKLIAEHASGFCPVEFAIPLDIDDEDSGNSYWKEDDIEDKTCQIANMAIVAGCVWGDDSGGWKLEAVDLRNISDGKLEVKPLFGYFESSYSGRLDLACRWSSEDSFLRIDLPMMTTFQFDKDLDKSGFFGYNFEDLKQYRGSSWDHYQIVKTYDRDKKKEIKKEDFDTLDLAFDSWYEGEQSRFHCAQMTEKEIARSAFDEAMRRCVKIEKVKPQKKQTFIERLFKSA